MRASAFASALDRQQTLCPASCACARVAANATLVADALPPVGGHCASSPRGLRAYLAAVYPVATQRIAAMDDRSVAALFDSLHFYYDYGCHRSLAALEGCSDPGVLLRWLYEGLLPCTEKSSKGSSRQSLAPCVQLHSRFEPEWARAAVSTGYMEIEHRAIGFAVRTTGAQLTRMLTGGSFSGEPINASAFLDAGVAAMWYTFRRGSGIFYKLGRVKMAAGKTAMIAELLREIGEIPMLASFWPGFATRASLFDKSGPSAGASVDAERIQSVANGSASCTDMRLQPCRCRYVLHDAWDDAMVWMARALGYETLFITATLLCNQPISLGSGAASSARGFATAYPELVDVRPLDAKMVHEQSRGVHAYLQEAVPTRGAAERQEIPDLYTRRKQPGAADAWVRQMRDAGLLSLRDPFDVASNRHARPCTFSVNRWTLQCDDHVSSRWPTSNWTRCGIIGCGFKPREVGKRNGETDSTGREAE